MVSIATLLMCIFAVLVTTLLPPAVLLVYAKQHKGKKIVSAWLLGAAGFFVTQILIRVPIVTVLQTLPGFMTFSTEHGFLFAFALAFTAGLFELAGRFCVAKIMRNDLSYQRSFSAGLGHGGIEAMFLAGGTYLTNIVFILMINGGTFDALIAETAQTGMDVSALWQMKDSLIQSPPAMFLLGIYERILAMICHLAMSLVVSYGVRTGKALKGALICLGIHTLIDLSAGINMLVGTVLSQTAAYVIIYTILTVAAALSVLMIINIRRRWHESEV